MLVLYVMVMFTIKQIIVKILFTQQVLFTSSGMIWRQSAHSMNHHQTDSCTVWIITRQAAHADGTRRQQTKQISSKPTHKQRKREVLGAWYQQWPIRQQRIPSLHAVKCVTFNQFIRPVSFSANNSNRTFGITNCVTSEQVPPPPPKKCKEF
jgi:hypothetical protein